MSEQTPRASYPAREFVSRPTAASPPSPHDEEGAGAPAWSQSDSSTA